jgi:hypothetical protein
LDRVAHIDVADLIFGDEMSSDPKSFQKKLLLAENAEGTKLILEPGLFLQSLW